jgi:hypothetical protein
MSYARYIRRKYIERSMPKAGGEDVARLLDKVNDLRGRFDNVGLSDLERASAAMQATYLWTALSRQVFGWAFSGVFQHIRAFDGPSREELSIYIEGAVDVADDICLIAMPTDLAFELEEALDALNRGETTAILKPNKLPGKKNKFNGAISLRTRRYGAVEWCKYLEGQGHPAGVSEERVARAYGVETTTIREWKKGTGTEKISAIDEWLCHISGTVSAGALLAEALDRYPKPTMSGEDEADYFGLEDDLEQYIGEELAQHFRSGDLTADGADYQAELRYQKNLIADSRQLGGE